MFLPCIWGGARWSYQRMKMKRFSFQLKVDIFRAARLHNLQPRVLQELAKLLSRLLMLIFNNLEQWERSRKLEESSR